MDKFQSGDQVSQCRIELWTRIFWDIRSSWKGVRRILCTVMTSCNSEFIHVTAAAYSQSMYTGTHNAFFAQLQRILAIDQWEIFKWWTVQKFKLISWFQRRQCYEGQRTWRSSMRQRRLCSERKWGPPYTGHHSWKFKNESYIGIYIFSYGNAANHLSDPDLAVQFVEHYYRYPGPGVYDQKWITFLDRFQFLTGYWLWINASTVWTVWYDKELS